MKIDIDVFYGPHKSRPDREPNVRFTIDVQAEYCDTTINDAFKDEFIKKFMTGFFESPRLSLPPMGISTKWLDCTKKGFNVFLTTNSNYHHYPYNSQENIYHNGTEENLLICARFCGDE